MGYLISSLTDSSVTPIITGEYCIYLVHEWHLRGIAKSISKDFREYSTRLGNHASIFAASDQDSYNNSFMELLNSDPWFKITVGDYYNLSPGIIITKPGLPQFSASPDQVFIYVSDTVINLAYQNPHQLSQELIDLCRHDDALFIRKILPYSRGALVSPGPQTNRVLEILKDIIMIEPNIGGFGIKIMPAINHARNLHLVHRQSDQKNENGNHDCVIYQF